MTNEDKDKKEYELAVLLGAEDDLAGVLALISQHNGEMVGEPRAKNVALAYEIKGKREAVFAYCGVKAFGDDMKALEHDLNTRGDILRFLIVIAPSAADRAATPFVPRDRRGRPPVHAAPTEAAKPAPHPLSNEALEKKIEEILK